jgi:hypothetical protein
MLRVFAINNLTSRFINDHVVVLNEMVTFQIVGYLRLVINCATVSSFSHIANANALHHDYATTAIVAITVERFRLSCP